MATVVTVKAEGQPVNVLVKEGENVTTYELSPGQSKMIAVTSDQSLEVVYPEQKV